MTAGQKMNGTPPASYFCGWMALLCLLCAGASGFLIPEKMVMATWVFGAVAWGSMAIWWEDV